MRPAAGPSRDFGSLTERLGEEGSGPGSRQPASGRGVQGDVREES